MSPATPLLDHALNFLGGEVHDDALHLSDSFGTLRFPLHKRRLLTPDGHPITARTALLTWCTRPPGTNAEGLTEGTLLTPLGPTSFHLTEVTERLSGRHLRLSLRREGPLTKLGGVIYDGWATSAYRQHSHYSSGTTCVRREGGWLVDMPDGIRRAIWQTMWDAQRSVATPAAEHQASINARHADVARARRGIEEAQAALTRAELALGAQRYAPHPLPKGA